MNRFTRHSLIAIGTCVFLLLLLLVGALMAYPAEYVRRVLWWGNSDALDWQKFPSHVLAPASSPRLLPAAADPRVAGLFSRLAGTENWDTYLAANHSQAFIVIHDGTVVYEAYFNGGRRDSMVTSFSVAKSVTSALVGIALDEGKIESVDDPITRYLPELAERDVRFGAITIRHLLRMASGLDYRSFRPFLFNGDDPLTSYFPDQRQLALERTRIVDPPGEHFLYNKYHPQLLGMILERTTGQTVTDFLWSHIWEPLGMEFGGSWSTDSQESDFERMEVGLNARAIDFGRFGLLFLNGGKAGVTQVVSPEWVAESTEPYFGENSSYYPAHFGAFPGRAYYQSMWWGFARDAERYDFAAMGDLGQFIYVVPHKRLVIVRNGTDYGVPAETWLRLFYNFGTLY